MLQSDSSQSGGTTLIPVVPASGTSGEFNVGFTQFQINEEPARLPCSATTGIVTVLPSVTGNVYGDPLDFISSYAYIPNRGDNTISVIDTTSREPVATILVGASPYGVAIDSRGLRTYISNQAGGSISVIDAEKLEVSATIPTTGSPAGVTLDQQTGNLLVALESNNAIAVFNTTTLEEIARIILSNPPHDLVVSPDSRRAYALSRSAAVISVIDLESLAEVSTVPLAIDQHIEPSSLVLSRDGTRIYSSLNDPNHTSSVLTVTDTATENVSYAVNIDQPVIDIFLDTNGEILFLAPESAGPCTDIMSIDLATFTSGNTVRFPGKVVRGKTDYPNIYVITQDDDAFTSANIYSFQTNTLPVHSISRTGSKPNALGNFFGPVRKPNAALDTETLDFGPITINESATRTVTITNTGGLPLKIYRASFDNPSGFIYCNSSPCQPPDPTAFTIFDDECTDNTVPVDSSCSISVQYSPIAEKLYSETLYLGTNDSAQPRMIQLSGTTRSLSIAQPQDEQQTQSISTAESKESTGDVNAIDLIVLALAYNAFAAVRRRSSHR
ncbi:MAG: hypothetical protein AB7Q01_10555 [Gammaproteobacteria bacterium]